MPVQSGKDGGCIQVAGDVAANSAELLQRGVGLFQLAVRLFQHLGALGMGLGQLPVVFGLDAAFSVSWLTCRALARLLASLQ